MRARVRQWVTPRALLLHLAFLSIAAGCLTAAWWQINRAMQGNTLSYLYSVEWPAFVVVAGIGWWQMVHDTPQDIEERRKFRAQMRAASAEVVARTLPRSALAIEVGSKEAGRRALAGAGRPEIGGGEGAASGSLVFAGGTVERVDAEARLIQGGGDGVPHDETADDMTDYNRYLALLAVKGKAKTWRNPRGL